MNKGTYIKLGIGLLLIGILFLIPKAVLVLIIAGGAAHWLLHREIITTENKGEMK